MRNYPHHPEYTEAEDAVRAYLADIGVNFRRFVNLVSEHETMGFHEATEASLYEMSCNSLVIEPLLTDLARLTANYFCQNDFLQAKMFKDDPL